MKSFTIAAAVALTAVTLTGCKLAERTDQALDSAGYYAGAAVEETWSILSLRVDDPAYDYYDAMAKDLISPSRTAIENHGRRARTIILNNDQAREDVDRILLFDRPFRNINHPTE